MEGTCIQLYLTLNIMTIIIVHSSVVSAIETKVNDKRLSFSDNWNVCVLMNLNTSSKQYLF